MNNPVLVDIASITKARFTTAEFFRMSEAGAFADMKVELIDGELERMNQPMSAHAGLQTKIIIRLAVVAGEDRVLGDVAIDLAENTVVGCDAVLLRAPVIDNRALHPEDILLVVEVAQTSLDRDMGLKRVKYAGAGIDLYWVVDGVRSVVHIYADPVDGDYASINTVKFGDPLAVPGTDRTITID